MIRPVFPLFFAAVLASCSTVQHADTIAPLAPETLMKSLTGQVDFHLARSLPPDAALDVTLLDVSRKDAPARVVATDHIVPLGPSPATFVLAYEPRDLAENAEFALSARVHQGGKLLARNDAHVAVPTDATDALRIVVSPVE